jgi:hypothetical protein
MRIGRPESLYRPLAPTGREPVLNSLPKFRLDDRLVLAGVDFLSYPAAAPRNRTGFPRIPTGLKPPDVRGPEFSPRQSDKKLRSRRAMRTTYR